jgi:hypothetical protein
MKNEELTLDALSLIRVTNPNTSIKKPTINGGTVLMFKSKKNVSNVCIIFSFLFLIHHGGRANGKNEFWFGSENLPSRLTHS